MADSESRIKMRIVAQVTTPSPITFIVTVTNRELTRPGRIRYTGRFACPNFGVLSHPIAPRYPHTPSLSDPPKGNERQNPPKGNERQNPPKGNERQNPSDGN
jgi:hypothetical protein